MLAVRALEGAAGIPPLWQSNINAWGAAHPTGAQEHDPRLRLVNQYADEETGLHYHLARYYDPAQGRYLSPDPAGIADVIDRHTPDSLKLDTTVYVSGRPYDFFDPDAAAKIMYYALTTGADGKALGTTQGFTKARWAFVIYDIEPGGDPNTNTGQLRNQYAANGTVLFYDGGGDLIGGTDDPLEGVTNWSGSAIKTEGETQGSAVMQAFTDHYTGKAVSLPSFAMDLDDDYAAKLVQYLMSDAETRALCGDPTGWLPDIRFAPEDTPIKVTSASNGNTSKQRILACGEGSGMNLNQRRIAKYVAAAELNETYNPKQINKDCSADGCPGVKYYCDATGCKGANNPPASATTYIASYGATQITGPELITQLRTIYSSLSDADKETLGLTPAVMTGLNKANSRAEKLEPGKSGNWWSAIQPAASYADAAAAWDNLTSAQQEKFTQETGLGEQAYEDIVRLKTSPPTNSNGLSLLNDARVGLQTAAIMTDSDIADLFMEIYKDTEKFKIVNGALLQKNLTTVLGKFPDASEEELAARVARIHNSGAGQSSNWDDEPYTSLLTNDANNYVKRFLGSTGYQGEGNWHSLRCVESLGTTIGGLEIAPLVLK